MSLQVISCFCYSNIDQKRVPSFQVLPIDLIEGSQKMVTDVGGQGVLGQEKQQVASPHVERLLFILKSPIHCLVYDGQLSFHPKTWHVMM